MTITLTTALSPAGKWVVFGDGADLSQFDGSKIVTWQLDSKAPTVASLIRTNDNLTDFGLRRDKEGYYNPTALNLAYQVAFAQEHLTKIAGPDGAVDGPTQAQVEALPPQVLAAYVQRADTSRGVAVSDLDFLKKPSGGESALTTG